MIARRSPRWGSLVIDFVLRSRGDAPGYRRLGRWLTECPEFLSCRGMP